MNTIFRLLLISIALFSFHAFSQDVGYARAIIDTLCSEAFDGRGYFNNGERKAAEFISQEYENIGLKKFKASYFQEFQLPVNSISGKTRLVFDGIALIPGADYLIDPASPGYAGKSKLILLRKEQLTDIEAFKRALRSLRNKYVVIDQTLFETESKEIKSQVFELLQFLKYSPDIELNGIIELIKGKLTYSAAQQTAARPHLVMLKSKMPEKIKTVEVHIENEFNPQHTSQNVIGYIEGKRKDSFLFITAHYDHLGRMGDAVYFPGANDNASGVAMLLSLAKSLAKEKPEQSIVFIAFGSEEIGLVGSRYFTENPVIPLKKVTFLLNLDILGTGDDGIQVVNGKEFRKDFDRLVNLNNEQQLLKQVKIRGAACNSDHCFFYEKGVPCFFIYTLGGIAHYHNIYDKAATLPLTEFNDLFVLLKSFILSK